MWLHKKKDKEDSSNIKKNQTDKISSQNGGIRKKIFNFGSRTYVNSTELKNKVDLVDDLNLTGNNFKGNFFSCFF